MGWGLCRGAGGRAGDGGPAEARHGQPITDDSDVGGGAFDAAVVGAVSMTQACLTRRYGQAQLGKLSTQFGQVDVGYFRFNDGVRVNIYPLFYPRAD
ncbi:hypothetical protein MAHJHV61_35660 [Mycobacterium avium subsp. hominissuis]